MKNAKQFIDTLKHNKVFKRVLSVVLSLTMLIGIAQIIAVALPEPKADLDVSFAVTSYNNSLTLQNESRTIYFNEGDITVDSGQAIAAARDGYRFAYWTKGDGENAEIYSYSPAITPAENGTYYAWFAQSILYVGQTMYMDDPDWRQYEWYGKTGNVNIEDRGFDGCDVTGNRPGPDVYGTFSTDLINRNRHWWSVIVVEPTLLETAIQGTDYELVDFPVTLFDYDMEAFNAAHPFTNGNYETLHFWDGSSQQDYGLGFSNYGNSYPKDGENAVQAAAQGIWDGTLDENGLPVPNPALGGSNTDLFKPVTDTGKTVYNDVSFQFVKDSEGWYTYDSALSYAQYDETAKEVKLYYESLGIGSTGDKVAGFLPFNTFNSSYYSGGSTYPLAFSDWESKLTSSTRQTGVYALDNVNYHNGMVMEYSFYLPDNGTVDGTEGGTPIQFEFNGDDDMWVFVDGELVLDIGGGHGAIAGTINFQNGTAWVERAVTSQDQSPSEYNGTFVCDTDQYHEIKIFYLERFAGESNCRIRFNLPAVPQKSINIEKQVETETEGGTLPESVHSDEFEFELWVKKYGEDYVSAANAEYSVVKTSNPNVVIRTENTDENGRFKLHAGERAIFEDYDSTDLFYVTEIMTDALSKKYGIVKCDGIQDTTGILEHTSMPKQVTNKGNRVVFTNILTDTLAGAELSKTAADIGNGQYKITLSITGAVSNAPITVTDTVSQYFDIVSANGTINGQAVTFTGKTNASGSWTGEITIKPKEEFWGGNAVPTNDTQGAFATSAAEIPHSFGDASPTVNVPINLPGFDGKTVEMYLGQDAPKDSELFTPINIPTGDDAWKVAYVETDSITYNVSSNPNYYTKPGSHQLTVTAAVQSKLPANTGANAGAPANAGLANAIATVTVKTCTLTITKSGGDANGNYIFKLSGTGNDLAEGINTVASVGKDGSVTIKGLPIGTYTVTEDSNWSWRYSAENVSAILSPEQDTADVTVTNRKANDKWLDAEDAVLNDFE